MKSILADLLMLAGGGMWIYAGWQIHSTVGWIVSGAVCLVGASALEFQVLRRRRIRALRGKRNESRGTA